MPALAILRYLYDGESPLGEAVRVDLRKAVRAYYCGCRNDSTGECVEEVLNHLRARPWRTQGVAPYWF